MIETDIIETGTTDLIFYFTCERSESLSNLKTFIFKYLPHLQSHDIRLGRSLEQLFNNSLPNGLDDGLPNGLDDGTSEVYVGIYLDVPNTDEISDGNFPYVALKELLSLFDLNWSHIELTVHT